ncbi:MAG: hypothetical protein ACRD0H_10155 [Actinomycetes bacterium]
MKRIAMMYRRLTALLATAFTTAALILGTGDAAHADGQPSNPGTTGEPSAPQANEESAPDVNTSPSRPTDEIEWIRDLPIFPECPHCAPAPVLDEQTTG